MSTEIPGRPESERNGDDDAVFEELARRAGAALRRPAPVDGVRAIAARRRRQQALKATVVGGAVVASLIGALVVVSRPEDPDRLPPVDSTPATIPVTATPAPITTVSVVSSPDTSPRTTTPAVAIDTTPVTTIDTSRQTQLFTEVAPDTMVTLPLAPFEAPQWATVVWSGSEAIAWGVTSTGAGVAFNPATGTWRITAPAPIDGRASPAAVWTGTEMIVWGGNPFGLGYADGAAYNPVTDTWRRLPDAPLGPGSTPAAVWTGDEVVIIGAHHIGDVPTDDGTGDTAAAAYNPATDEWRPLADLPGENAPTHAVWTGTTILTGDLAYDVSTDTWNITGDDARYIAVVALPGSDGVARTVIALPAENGAPVAVLDSAGNSVGSLPGIPADRGALGDRLSGIGVWAGDEALFWIHNGANVFIPGDPLEGWALNPATKTWRPLPGTDLIPTLLSNAHALVATGDVVLAWEEAHIFQGIAYRAPTSATG
jgi:hypothetical protein